MHMKPTYTVLSFCFGDYDILREPKVVDPNAEYVYVTDRQIKSTHWKVLVDTTLANKNPIYAAYYVRYNPFRYASTPNVILLDSSVQINDSLAPIAEECLAHDYTVMLTNYRTDEDKLKQWTTVRGMKQDEADRVLKFIDKTGTRGQKGSIGRAFTAMKDTQAVRRFNRHVWRYLLALGQYGIPNRMDEVVAHKLIARYTDSIDFFYTSIQIVQSTFLTYCKHRSLNTPIPMYNNYDQYYSCCGNPVSPVRFDKGISFPRHYTYRTEAMLLTRYMEHRDLMEWLEWHLDRVGFDHVHVFDNSCRMKTVCDCFGDRVSYQQVHGHPRQYRLYDAYVNGMSEAEWVMPINDDEYLDIGDFKSIGEALDYYREKLPHVMVLGIRWKHLFPESFRKEREGSVLEYCKAENPELAKKFMPLGDRGIKCIVRRYGEVHFEETWENPAGGHVPKHSCFYGAVMCDGSAVLGCGMAEGKTLEDERIRLLHCRYKGPEDWSKKKGCRTVCDWGTREKRFEFDHLIDELN